MMHSPTALLILSSLGSGGISFNVVDDDDDDALKVERLEGGANLCL